MTALGSGALPSCTPGPTAACLDPAEAKQRLEHLQDVRAALEAVAARAAATRAAAEQRADAARQQLQAACEEADAQHRGVADALAQLASRLDALALGGGSKAGASSGQHPPAPLLLGAALPDAYARACTGLLNALSGYVQHHNGSGGGDASSSGGCEGSLAAAQAHQRRQSELARLQGCLCEAERLRVEEEAEMARCACSIVGDRCCDCGAPWLPLAARLAMARLRHPCSAADHYKPTLALHHHVQAAG